MSQKGDTNDNTKADAGTLARAPTPAARRALAEAAERRAAAERMNAPPRREIDGRGGEEPVRFGDWEVKGLATDF